MTQTDDLIAQLASEGADSASRSAFVWRFVALLAGALALAGLAVSLLLDGAFASVAVDGMGPLYIKWGFSLVLMMLAALSLWVLGEPGRNASYLLIALAMPFTLVAMLFALDLSTGGGGFPGTTWRTCLAAMALMSPPAFGFAVMAMRALAPTEPRRAGALAGLFGGAVAMTAYAPFCPERGMTYLVVFYCLPILAMAAFGWLSGAKLLRW